MALKNQIEAILARHDPVKLIAIGAPLDEYSSESKLIADIVDGSYTIPAIQQIVYEVFSQQFGNGTAYQTVDGQLMEVELDPVGADQAGGAQISDIIGEYDGYHAIAEDIEKLLRAS